MSDEKPKLRKRNNYPHRNYKQLEHHRYVEYLISLLADLERETDPAGGPDTADGKDLRAFQALRYAGDLVAALAGWAIDHQIGLAIKGWQFVPNQPSGTQNHAEYRKNRSSVDDHAHERKGALASTASRSRDKASSALPKLTPKIMRNIWVNLLKANPCGVDYHLRDTLWKALTALDYGEVQPIIERARTKKSVV